MQKEYPGTESKSETEALLRRAMEDYEKSGLWRKRKTSPWRYAGYVGGGRTEARYIEQWHSDGLSGTVGRIKRHPLGKRKLKTVTADHLQAFIDFMSYGAPIPMERPPRP